MRSDTGDYTAFFSKYIYHYKSMKILSVSKKASAQIYAKCEMWMEMPIN